MNKEHFVLSRRRFLISGVAAATTIQLQHAARALGLAAESGACKLAAEQEVGPYYVAEELLRSDISEGKPGVPLSLRVVLLDAHTCKPLPNAAVDLWHCDAVGLYSGFTQQNPMGPGGPGGFGGPPPGGPRPEGPPLGFDPEHPGRMGRPPENHPTDRLTFLRGIQLTGPNGAVSFRTVFPGFYMGRTNHIHFKVRVAGHATGKSYEAGHTSHNGQIFFPEEIATELMWHEPYSAHKIHRTTQDEDHVFGDQHGELSIASLQSVRPGEFAAGLHAELVAAFDPLATPAAVGVGPMGGPPPSEHQN